MNKWINDGVPFTGEAFRQWIRDFYQQNNLIKVALASAENVSKMPSFRGQRELTWSPSA
jgi:poly(3-hydroxyalkanoate) synthetase